jgi:hypothetical protein
MQGQHAGGHPDMQGKRTVRLVHLQVDRQMGRDVGGKYERVGRHVDYNA